MNWKNVLLWAFVSLTLLFLLITIGGFIYGFSVAVGAPDGNANLLFAVMLATFIFIKLYFMYFFQITGLILSAPVLWALLSLKFPGLETGKAQKLGLAMYCVCFGVLFWVGFTMTSTIASIYAFWGGVFVCLSLFLPRLMIKTVVDQAMNSGANSIEPESLGG